MFTILLNIFLLSNLKYKGFKMPFCPNCGFSIGYFKFCPNCGQNLENLLIAPPNVPLDSQVPAYGLSNEPVANPNQNYSAQPQVPFGGYVPGQPQSPYAGPAQGQPLGPYTGQVQSPHTGPAQGQSLGPYVSPAPSRSQGLYANQTKKDNNLAFYLILCSIFIIPCLFYFISFMIVEYRIGNKYNVSDDEG
ncbi:MAG: hypothetical protein LBE80_08545, partial [Deltaproteobacteria bacterium]|nr:hypothetical protein [Deltaproteobacteria bacterium]